MIKTTKQKYSQHDLRRLMQEQKNKAAAGQKAVTTARIESPLAKYNDLGQLTCILCQSVVRSEDVWKVHLNAKLHKENVIKARELKEKADTKAMGAPKRPAQPTTDDIMPPKKPKGILKNATPQVIAIPSVIPSASSSTAPGDTPMEVTEGEQSTADSTAPEPDATLPEGFFDDPKKDAIARNLEYKDPVQEEWDRFQKEIRDAATVSNDIIAEDQEESTAERQIVEIDEQIRNWDRVLAMEKKKEERLKHLEKMRQRPKPEKKKERKESDDEDEAAVDTEAGDVDEFGSWRAKGWNKSK